MTHWIVAQTKPKAEFLAQMNLDAQGYETYLPLVAEGNERDSTPFFPRYIFVNVEPRQGLWRPIVSTRGMASVLKTGERPSVVPPKVIELLRQREEAGVIRIKRRQAAQGFKRGQTVRIHEGQLQGFEAIFERVSGQDRVWLLIDFMGAKRPVEVEAEAVA